MHTKGTRTYVHYVCMQYTILSCIEYIDEDGEYATVPHTVLVLRADVLCCRGEGEGLVTLAIFPWTAGM